jgi:hypothetical protein
LGSLRLCENHLDALIALFFVVELSFKSVSEVITVLAGLVTEVVQHLLGAEVLTSDFLGVHEALPYRQKLVLAHLYHLSEFALLFIEASVLLLLLSKLGGSVEE